MPDPLLRPLMAPVRAYGQALLNGSDGPHAELLAMVWGPRFDREHAQTLLSRRERRAVGVVQTVMQAADQFDRLPQAQQQRVRSLILRHRRRWDNAACTASC